MVNQPESKVLGFCISSLRLLFEIHYLSVTFLNRNAI